MWNKILTTIYCTGRGGPWEILCESAEGSSGAERLSGITFSFGGGGWGHRAMKPKLTSKVPSSWLQMLGRMCATSKLALPSTQAVTNTPARKIFHFLEWREITARQPSRQRDMSKPPAFHKGICKEPARLHIRKLLKPLRWEHWHLKYADFNLASAFLLWPNKRFNFLSPKGQPNRHFFW